MGAAAPTRSRRGNPATKPKTIVMWMHQILLAWQAGLQPLVTKRFIRKNAIVTSIVLATEVAKVIFALLILACEGNWKKSWKEWSLSKALIASGLPAAIYALQNSLLQISYKNLDSLTFTILNQTKLLFTALFTYIVLGHKQSGKQMGALGLLVIAAILLSFGESSSKGLSADSSENALFYGIIPVLVASVLSGLASSLCQWATQVKKHTSYLMTVEMSCVGITCLLASTSKTSDGKKIKELGFFHAWTLLTLIPIFLNAVGGILVGLVTAYAGGVKKGFVIVSALLITALLQFIFEGKQPSLYCLAALPIVVLSNVIYHRHPYKPKEKKA